MAATCTAAQRPHLTRTDHDNITDQPRRGETGFVAHARDLARALCQAAAGRSWRAEARSPAWPSRAVDQHTQIAVAVDHRWLIVVTTTSPAGTGLERWTITVNSRPVAHRTHPGEVPHHTGPIARSLWRHLHDVPVEPCDSLLCKQPATVATWGRSTCPAHADQNNPPPLPM